MSKIGLCGASVVLPGGKTLTLGKESRGGVPAEKGSGNGCRATLKAGGTTLWYTLLGCGWSPEDARMDLHEMGEGKAAVHLKIPSPGGGGLSEYVLVREAEGYEFKTVWSEETALVGDLGERVRPMVRFHDLSGDAHPEIVVGTTSEAVSLCGAQEPPLLFRRVYDWKKGVFRPVLARRTGLAEPEEIQGISLPESEQKKPLVDQTVPLSVSRSVGDRGEPILLAPPQALVDGDPRTAWIPTPNNGAGEFATLKTLAHVYGITAVGVRPLPEVKRPKKYDRPRSLFLAAEDRVYRLVFPVDPLLSPEKMIWFELPSPLHSRCLSFIVESSYAPSAKTPLALAEIVLITEADGPGGLLKLAGHLNDPRKRGQAAVLLERAGSDSVDAIRQVWAKLGLAGKKRAVAVVAGADPGAGVDILCEAALLGRSELSQTALRGIKKAGDRAVPILEQSMLEQKQGVFERVVEILASLGTNKSLEALAKQVGKGSGSRRKLLRTHLGQMGLAREENAAQLFSLIKEEQRDGRKERLLDLVRALALHPGWARRLSPIANEMFDQAEGFADRYRVLKLHGTLGCHGNREYLLSAAQDPDPLIRAVAIEGLGHCAIQRESAVARAGEGLRDSAVEVRLSSLSTLGKLGAADDYQPVIGVLATSDPWPEIRARSTDIAAALPHKETLKILAVTKEDSSPLVRIATLKSVQKIAGEQASKIIEGFLGSNDEESRIRILATVIAAKRCQRSAIPVLFAALRRGAEPLAEREDVDVAVASARALGIIGGPRALEYLNQAKRRSNPRTDRAIESALASRSSYCSLD